MWNQPPYSYIQQNIAASSYSPSTIHTRNNELFWFFCEYLMMEVFSVLKFTIPRHWAKNYFRYTLMMWGFIAIVRTNKYGVICQQCGLRGYNIFYQPTNAVIVNPLLTGILEPRIGTQCTVVKIKDNYQGLWNLVSYYADNMAITAEALEMNTFGSKLSYLFAARNKAGAESLKKILDSVMSGEPGVFYDEKLKNVNRRTGEYVEPWTTFTRDLKNNFISPDLCDLMRRWKEMFCNEIGINNVRSDKKERLITAEADANNEERMSKIELIMENIKEGFEEANNMFSLDLKVELRNGGGDNVSVPVSTGITVQ